MYLTVSIFAMYTKNKLASVSPALESGLEWIDFKAVDSKSS